MPSDFQHAKQATLISAVVNFLLSVLKVMIGYLSASNTLLADGLHSLSDLFSDALVFVAAKAAAKNPDPEHPYGHRRIETLIIILVAFLMLAVGITLIYSVGHQFLNKTTSNAESSWPVVLIALLSVAANEGLYHYMKKIATAIHSNLIESYAWHHRTDAFTSLLVLFTVIGKFFGIPYLDNIGAIVIAGMIIQIGIRMAWRSLRELIDAGAEPRVVAHLRQVIARTPGIVSVHQLRTRTLGGKLFVDVHVIVEPKITVSEGHYIGHQVHLNLLEQCEDVLDVTVHVDPEDDEASPNSRKLPNRPDLQNKLNECWQALPGFQAITAVQLHYLNEKLSIDLYFDTNVYPEGFAQRAALQKNYLAAAVAPLPFVAELSLFFY